MSAFTHIDKSLNFNSHAHVERDVPLGTAMFIPRYFNSHAHVERDKTTLDSSYRILISTHTLTWSVTLKFSRSRKYKKFQLTRSRGA